MTISFDSVPATLVPGVYMEIESARLPVPGEHVRPTFIAAPMMAAGTATANSRYSITSAAQARTLFGRGSTAALMCERWLANNPTGQLVSAGIADNSGGTAATGTIQITHASTAAGTLALYIAGRLIEVPVAASAAVGDIAAAIETACDADLDLPVTADAVTDTVTFTSNHKGTIGNQINLAVNLAGETLPAGVTVTITAMASGATDPALDGITAVGADEFDWVVLPWSDTTHLNNWKAAIDAWWGPTDQRMPYLVACLDDAYADLVAAGAARNAKHESLCGISDCPTPAYEVAAATAAQAAAVLDADPALPVGGRPLVGVRAPADASRHTWAQRHALLNAGVTTFTVARDGTVQIERMRSTYKTDTSGASDAGWLDVNRSTIARRIVRRTKARLARDFVGHKYLANERTIGSGSRKVATNASIKGAVVAEGAQMAADGIIEDMDAFKAGIVVEQDGTDANRANVYVPVNPANQLQIIAVAARMGA